MKTIILADDIYIGTQFPVALEYGDESGLTDEEIRQLDDWYSGYVSEAEDRYTSKPCLHFDYGEASEFETCSVTGLKGNCVAVTVFILV